MAIGLVARRLAAGLVTVLSLCAAPAAVQAGGGEEDVLTLSRPPAGQTWAVGLGEAYLVLLPAEPGRAKPVLRLDGPDLLIRLPAERPDEDATIRLTGFVGAAADLALDIAGTAIAGGSLNQVLQASPPGTAIRPADLSVTEPAAGPGGPLASVPVFGWFLSRLQGTSEAAAAEAIEPAAGDLQGARLAELLAGLELLKARRFEAAADDLVAGLKTFDELMAGLVESGRGTMADLDLTKGWLAMAKLEQAQARGAVTLALDAYQDRTGERPPPDALQPPAPRRVGLLDDLESFLGAVPEDRRAEARRAWRRMTQARDSLALRGQQLDKLERLRAAYRGQFDVGRRTISDLLSIERALFDSRVDLIEAESRVQAERGRALAAADRLEEADLATVASP